jgi:hypothetical protein
MKRHLIWIIAGTATVGLAVPAFAAMQPASPDDNGIPGEIRGNCDEAEHANDPECLAFEGGPTTPSTVDVPVGTSPSTTIGTPTTARETTLPRGVPTTSVDDRPTASIAPPTSVSGGGPVGTVPDSTLPDSTVPDSTVPTGVPDDVSGPCDEAEHADDPRCTGSTTDRGSDDDGDDRSGHGGDDDDDDRSGHGGDDDDDDRSGHGGDDDGDDDSGHGSDD